MENESAVKSKENNKEHNAAGTFAIREVVDGLEIVYINQNRNEGIGKEKKYISKFRIQKVFQSSYSENIYVFRSFTQRHYFINLTMMTF